MIPPCADEEAKVQREIKALHRDPQFCAVGLEATHFGKYRATCMISFFLAFFGEVLLDSQEVAKVVWRVPAPGSMFHCFTQWFLLTGP